jgi:predicted RNase H-like nuclease (RuvC/YqgF family)
MLNARSRRGLIAGLDAGTTTAVALLDLRGNLLDLKSKKNFSKKEVQEFIQQKGQPVLITTDVVKVPKGIVKIASAFNTKTDVIEKNLERKEKKEIVCGFLKKYNKKPENKHEADALAAAIVCYNKHENKFRQIERQLSERGVLERADEVKEKVVRGVSVNRVLEGRR